MVIEVRVENLQDILAKYKKAQEAAAGYADDDRAHEVMKSNIRENFDVLEGGGGMPAAGGGGVSWGTERAQETRMQRERIGTGPLFPILRATGEMQQDYTETPIIDTVSEAGGSDAVLRGGSSASRDKARKHHEGGMHLAVFEDFENREMRFPRRPFAFWNPEASERIAQGAGDAAEEAWLS